MPSGGKIGATHAPGRGRELDKYACRVQRTSRRLDFPRQGTHGSYAVHRVDGCALTRVLPNRK